MRDGNPAAPPQKRGQSPLIFAACLLWPNGWMDQDTTWYEGRLRPRPHCARWGPSSPFPKRGCSPQFSAHAYSGQMAGWIKMPLGTKVGLNPDNIIFDGDPDPPPPKKGAQLPISGPCLLCPNGWMDQDTTWYGGRPPPKRHCVRWVPIYPLSKKGA